MSINSIEDKYIILKYELSSEKEITIEDDLSAAVEELHTFCFEKLGRSDDMCDNGNADTCLCKNIAILSSGTQKFNVRIRVDDTFTCDIVDEIADKIEWVFTDRQITFERKVDTLLIGML